MKRLPLLLLALLVLAPLGAPRPTRAQDSLGSAFLYQGRLADGGASANGVYDFRFRLYDAATGGTLVGDPTTVTAENITVSNGLFRVLLDFGESAFNGSARWLEVAVRPGDSNGAYTTLTPRRALTSATSAIFSRRAPWTGLIGIPDGFADGVDDNTTYSAGSGLVLSNTAFSLAGSYRLPQGCEAAETAKWNGSAWECAGDAGSTAWELGGNADATAASILGPTGNVTFTLVVSNVTALRLTPGNGKPNVLGGNSSNQIVPGAEGATIGGGASNTIGGGRATIGGGEGNFAGHEATVSGGTQNRAEGATATIGGGERNLAEDSHTTISGGYSNTIEFGATAATIGGGKSNTVVGEYASIGGGEDNDAIGNSSTVGGGYSNSAGGTNATVGGGSRNEATELAATVGGGEGNSAEGSYTTVSGGDGNVAGYAHATVGGGESNVAGGPHTTIGGGYDNTVATNARYATIGGGSVNTASALYTTVSGGYSNTIGSNALNATVSGGYSNTVATGAGNATIGGGTRNTTRAKDSTIGGGHDNITFDLGAGTIGGGGGNTAGWYSTVGGGGTNTASGPIATIGGGSTNTAGGFAATVSGGFSNTVASGTQHATIGGGSRNTATAQAHNGTINGGYSNTISASNATVSGGYSNTIGSFASNATVSGGYSNTIGSNALNATVSGGVSNTIGSFASNATVSGGTRNAAGAPATTIGGGYSNTIGTYAWNATVSGGVSNTISASNATVSGGYSNTIGANASYATVSGGNSNTIGANAQNATIAGGSDNRAGANYATVAGGAFNSATGAYAFTAGRRAKANHQGTFVWGDSTDIDFASTATNQFLVRAGGGVGLGTNAPVAQLHVVEAIDGGADLGNHVAVIENNASTNANGPDVLALKTSAANPSGSTNFITFFDADSALGRIEGDGSGGVTYLSGGADFAEYLPKRHGGEAIAAGDLVGLAGGKVGRRTAGAERVLVVSTSPGFAGNMPPEAERDAMALVALVGQVPVRVRGPVRAGDYIVPSGRHDGTGVALAAAQVASAGTPQIVGRALESSSESGVKLVTVLVGLPDEQLWQPLLQAKDDRIALLEQDNDARQAEIAALEMRLEALEAAVVAAAQPERAPLAAGLPALLAGGLLCGAVTLLFRRRS